MALAGSCARACDLGSAQAGNHGFARMGKIIIEILKAGGAMQGLRSARYQCSSTNIRENPELIYSFLKQQAVLCLFIV